MVRYLHLAPNNLGQKGVHAKGFLVGRGDVVGLYGVQNIDVEIELLLHTPNNALAWVFVGVRFAPRELPFARVRDVDATVGCQYHALANNYGTGDVLRCVVFYVHKVGDFCKRNVIAWVWQ